MCNPGRASHGYLDTYGYSAGPVCTDTGHLGYISMRIPPYAHTSACLVSEIRTLSADTALLPRPRCAQPCETGHALAPSPS